MNVLIPSSIDFLSQVVHILSSGGMIIYPTETTYGLGVDATNERAVQKLLQYKKRRDGKPLSIAVADIQMAEKYVVLNNVARNVYKQFLPGPVTVISSGKHRVATFVESNHGTLGIRISSYPLVNEIVYAFGKPITATGANASDQKRPYSIVDVFSFLDDTQQNLIDAVIDVGELPHVEPSTIIDTTLDNPIILRQGASPVHAKNEFISHSVDRTKELGELCALQQKNHFGHKPIIFALRGEMGAGKTQFVKGIASALKIARTISSPTYVLCKEYQFEAEGKIIPCIHIDAWRLSEEHELFSLGFEKMLQENAVIAIEWADRTMSALERIEREAVVVWVNIAVGSCENDRVISW